MGDLGENRTINGIPRGINDCGAAFPAKFGIEDRTDRIYRVVPEGGLSDFFLTNASSIDNRVRKRSGIFFKVAIGNINIRGMR